ncbi:MAG: SBBP repeat-containing protein [Gemmatimonadales bacterium]
MTPRPLVARVLAALGLCAAVTSACGDDTTPPTVVLRATPCCQVTSLGASLVVEADATDDDGVSRVAFFAKAPGDPVATKFAEDIEAPFSVTYPSGGFAEADNGAHELSAEAYDAARNVGTSSLVIIVVVIDATAPGGTLTTTAGSRITTAGSVPLTAATSEPITMLELYDGAAKIGEVAATGTLPITHTFVVPVTGAENGTHVFTARALDVAGNSGESAPVSVSVDVRWAWRSEIWASGSYASVGALVADGTAGVYAGGVQAPPRPGLDAFLIKLDAAGAVLWTRTLGGPDSITTGVSVARDAAGDVYLGGAAASVASGAWADCFVVKYDPTGGIIWSRRIDSGAEDLGGYAGVDGLDGVYVAGSTRGSLDGNPNQGGSDAFVIKYDRDGNQLWVRQFGSAGGPIPDDDVSGMVVDPAGNVYIIGSTWGSIGGTPNPRNPDVFLTKYSAAGDALWARLLGTVSAGGLAVDPAGAVYVAGGVYAQPPDEYDVFVAKFDSAGVPVWSRQLGTGGWDYAGDLATDANGVHLVGFTSGEFDGIASLGADDIFLARLAHDGTLIDVRIYDTGAQEEGYAVAADGAGALYVGGIQRQTPALVLKHMP